MINKRFGAVLFLSSYAPAFLLVALRSYDRSCAVFALSVVLFAVSLVTVGVLFAATSRRAPYTVTVVAVEPRNSEVAAYAATYLLPFVTTFEGGWRDVLAVGLFFVFIGVIYVNSGMVHINPVLALIGFQVMEIRATTQASAKPSDVVEPQFLLSRSRWIRPKQRLTVRELMPDTLISFDRGESDASN